MRKIYLILIALAFIVGFSACKGGTSEPVEIGNQVFQILKDFDAKGKEGFIKKFMTIEEARELGRNEKVIPDLPLRNELTSMEKEEWIHNMSNSYNAIEKMGIDNEINWKKIGYSDFTYRIKYEESAAMYVEGKLTFMHNDKEYKLDVYSMWNGKEYMLVKMEEHK